MGGQDGAGIIPRHALRRDGGSSGLEGEPHAHLELAFELGAFEPGFESPLAAHRERPEDSMEGGRCGNCPHHETGSV